MVPEDAAEAENVRSMVSEEGERPDNYQFLDHLTLNNRLRTKRRCFNHAGLEVLMSGVCATGLYLGHKDFANISKSLIIAGHTKEGVQML